jgi:hypothetical protein
MLRVLVGSLPAEDAAALVNKGDHNDITPVFLAVQRWGRRARGAGGVGSLLRVRLLALGLPRRRVRAAACSRGRVADARRLSDPRRRNGPLTVGLSQGRGGAGGL